jgi:hypothetical protein
VAAAAMHSVCTACRRAIWSFTSNLRRFSATSWRLSVDRCVLASTISACSARWRLSSSARCSALDMLGGLLSRIVAGSLVVLRCGPAMPSTRLVICHVIREPLMCLATGNVAAQNLCEALHFQHSLARLLKVEPRRLGPSSRLITSSGHSGPTKQHHTGRGCAGSSGAPLFASRWKQPQATGVAPSSLP